MAESVDALVSNTSGATRAGSTPALGTSGTSKAGLNEKQGAVRQQLTALFYEILFRNCVKDDII